MACLFRFVLDLAKYLMSSISSWQSQVWHPKVWYLVNKSSYKTKARGLKERTTGWETEVMHWSQEGRKLDSKQINSTLCCSSVLELCLDSHILCCKLYLTQSVFYLISQVFPFCKLPFLFLYHIFFQFNEIIGGEVWLKGRTSLVSFLFVFSHFAGSN